jgi:hypothetical protein
LDFYPRYSYGDFGRPTMKRDMDLVRLLLLEAEEAKNRIMTKRLADQEQFAEYDLPMIDHHVTIMDEAGLIKAYHEGDRARGTYGWSIMRLTWDGHEFLDTVRDPEIWRKTKSGAAAAGGYAFGFLKDLATAYAKHVAKERLGLEIG